MHLKSSQEKNLAYDGRQGPYHIWFAKKEQEFVDDPWPDIKSLNPSSTCSIFYGPHCQIDLRITVTFRTL